MSVIDWILKKLADRLGVAPAEPRRGDQPPYSLRATVVADGSSSSRCVGAFALIVWLYRHEGRTSAVYKIVLAALRIMLVLLAVFMLSEAVLSVQRTGLPNLTIMVDDSASERSSTSTRSPRNATPSRPSPTRRRPRPPPGRIPPARRASRLGDDDPRRVGRRRRDPR